VDLPAGLEVSIELETAIDSTTVHVGDPLRGHVRSDVRQKAKTIIPKGAIVTGRIRGLERLRTPEPAIDLTIELAELSWENTRAEFYGELLPKPPEQARDAPFKAPMMNGRMSSIPHGAAANPVAGAGAGSVQIPGTGVLQMTGTRFQIPSGFRMNWRTLEPNGRLKAK
jgi:hypothetical protein